MVFSRRNFLLASTSLLTALAYSKRSNSMTGTPPNIVLIMADDVGYEAFGAYGSTFYNTPRLNALAAEGITFNHAYGTHLCTPSRVEIMTGKYNHRNYIRFSSLPEGERTFAQELKDAGYVTAVAGKWQLNAGGASQSQLPTEAGFDEYCVSPSPTAANGTRTGGGFYWFPSVNINNTWVETTPNDYGPDIFTNFINDFITRNQAQPFFAYFPMHLPHTPFDATPDSIDTSIREDPSVFPDMIAYLDKLVGRIVDNLETLGLRDNTLVIFTSDNGTNKAIVSPLNGENIRGGKASLSDGGTRLPFIASWRGTTPAGSITNQIIDFSDVYPTLADLGGVNPGTLSVDGQSFKHILNGTPGTDREFAFLYGLFKNTRFNGFWARDQRWKLYHDGRLYDVSNDRLEQQAIFPEQDTNTSRAIRDRLENHIASLDLNVLYPPKSTAAIPYLEDFERSSSFDCSAYQNAIEDPSNCIPRNLIRVAAPTNITGITNPFVGRVTMPKSRMIIQPVSVSSNSVPLRPGTTQLKVETRLGFNQAPLGNIRFKMRVKFDSSGAIFAQDEIAIDASFTRVIQTYESIIDVPAGVEKIQDVRLWFRQFTNVNQERFCFVESVKVSYLDTAETVFFEQNFENAEPGFSNMISLVAPVNISGSQGRFVGRLTIPSVKGEKTEAIQPLNQALPAGTDRLVFEALVGFVNPIQGNVEFRPRIRVMTPTGNQTLFPTPIFFNANSATNTFFPIQMEIPISSTAQQVMDVRLFVRQRNNVGNPQFLFLDNVRFVLPSS